MISPTEAQQPVFAIIISEKGGAERREAYDRPEITVGRVQGNDLMLPKGNVSKRHARLIFRDGRFIVTDLNSTNGTYVNRRRISQATIVREGDRVYIGDFVLRIDPAEADSAAGELGETTGSGPVLARESGPEGSVATHIPQEREEQSGASYPRVPGPPRLPDASRPSHAGPEPSSVAQRASIVDVSHADIDARSLAPAGEPSRDAAVQRQVLALLVDHATASVGPEALDGEISDAVRTSVERALTERSETLKASGEIDSSVDLPRLLAHARSELIELGPIGALLVDGSVSGIGLPRFDQLVAHKGSETLAVEPPFSSVASVARVVARLARAAGEPLSPNESIVERRMRDGGRLTAMLGRSVPQGPMLSIIKPPQAAGSLEELVRAGVVSRAIATFLQNVVMARVNVLVVGPRDPGTARMLSALLAVARSEAPMVLLEGRDDLSGLVANSASLRVLSGDDVRRSIQASASIPGVRIAAELSEPALVAGVLDAVRMGAEGMALVCYGSSIRSALTRLTAVCCQSGEPLAAAREAVASSVDLIVEIGRLRDGRHRALRVSEVLGATEDEIAVQDVFNFVVERTAAGGAVEGTFTASGIVPRVATHVASRGFGLETSLFSRPPSR
ncbi:MAG TPA: FHA domain-containing protein [Polyangiaceae bacterium]|nr:FHA domain-containing protein [Polyangiaceae bacterium]